jgi:hypothetical protein
MSVSLAISSEELAPEAITLRIGLQPTSTRRKGTPTRNGILRRAEFDLHEWWICQQLTLQSGVLLEKEAEAFITQFFDRFGSDGTESSIHALSADHNVLVLVVYHMGYMPYVGLTKGHVQALARLGARLDYDFMVDGPATQDQD